MKLLEDFTLCFTAIYAAIWILTWIENEFRIRNSESPCEVYDRRSLKVFKVLRVLTSLSAGVEVAFFRSQGDFLLKLLFGMALILSGLTFRILAIRSLGQFWSFHVVRYVDQPLIKSGIYRHISQPAYLGNIYLIGIYLGIKNK